MTKNLKRIISAVMAFVMILAMGSFAAFADDNTYALTIKDTQSGHEYNAYQIFKGDYANEVLSNIEWGSGVTVANPESTDAEEVAQYIIENYSDLNYFGDELVSYLEGIGVTINTTKTALSYVTDTGYSADVPEGYYLIKDEAANPDEEDFVFSSYMVQVVGDTSIEPKKSVPEVEKKVMDVNDSVTGETNNWQDSADYDIGDDVPFQLTGTLPTNYADYDKYEYVFHDTQSEGLDFNASSVVVKADGVEVKGGYEVVKEDLEDGCTFEVRFTDLKAITNEGGEVIQLNSTSKIVVEYTSKLNENAVIGSAGNPNKVRLEYSNNPNIETTTNTPEDKVTVFTFKFVINKVVANPDFGKTIGTEEGQVPEGTNVTDKYIPLTGAGFTLYKYDADAEGDDNWVALENSALTVSGDGTTFTFSGLDDGRYKIVESTVPAEYNKINDIYFKVEADHDVTSDDPKLTSLKATETDENGSKIEDNPIEITTVLLDGEGSLPEGTLSTDIENKKGSTLPETGGMGTKIFYTLGGILVVGAGVLLVARRRMKRA